VGGLCGRPLNKAPARMTPWNSMIWHLLALDFAMYDHTLIRQKYQTEVLGGFGSLFRNRALKDVAARHGNPWATDSIVEDYRLSLQLREAGWKIRVAPKALAYTDTPVTARGLWRQRIRWSGGTFQELMREGWKPWTRRNWWNYAMVWVGVLLRLLGVAAWTLILALHLPLTLTWYVVAPFVVAAIDRLVVSLRMRHGNWRTHLLAVSVLPLELLTLVGQAWSLRSTWLILRRRELAW
jgi:poly-beta-1,6-N-acetyl-D-glucosamine synthase